MQKRNSVQLTHIAKWSSKREEFPENKKKFNEFETENIYINSSHSGRMLKRR